MSRTGAEFRVRPAHRRFRGHEAAHACEGSVPSADRPHDEVQGTTRIEPGQELLGGDPLLGGGGQGRIREVRPMLGDDRIEGEVGDERRPVSFRIERRQNETIARGAVT